MDVLTHGLWGAALAYPKYKHQRKHLWIAFAFGVLPDLLAFVPATVYLFFHRTGFNPETYNTAGGVFAYARNAYEYTHSLVLFAVVFAAVIILRRGKIYWPMLAWPLHILMDIPTHPDFYSTPFLFPLSQYRFTGGLSWGNPFVFFPNWILLFITYGFILWDKRKKRNKANS